MKKIISIIFVLMLVAQVYSYAQSYKVIVNPNCNVSSLTQKEASDLFLKKKTKWTDGTLVQPVDQSANSKVREAFSQKVFNKTVAAIRSYWQQAVFSGTASAPPEKNSDAEVLEYVRKNPGAIGYVSESADMKGVKPITVN